MIVIEINAQIYYTIYNSIRKLVNRKQIIGLIKTPKIYNEKNYSKFL